VYYIFARNRIIDQHKQTIINNKTAES